MLLEKTMLDHHSNLADACRRAEQEAIAAIRAGSGPVSQAHQTLSLLHVARALELLRPVGMVFATTPQNPMPTELAT